MTRSPLLSETPRNTSDGPALAVTNPDGTTISGGGGGGGLTDTQLRATAVPATTVAGDEVRMNIKESTTVLNIGQLVISTANKAGTIVANWVGTPSSGSHTYKLSMLRQSGTGTVTNNAAATFPSFIMVETF